MESAIGCIQQCLQEQPFATLTEEALLHELLGIILSCSSSLRMDGLEERLLSVQTRIRPRLDAYQREHLGKFRQNRRNFLRKWATVTQQIRDNLQLQYL